MELLGNKKPRFKNRGFFCGPIKTNGFTKSTYLAIGDTPILIFHCNSGNAYYDTLYPLGEIQCKFIVLRLQIT